MQKIFILSLSFAVAVQLFGAEATTDKSSAQEHIDDFIAALKEQAQTHNKFADYALGNTTQLFKLSKCGHLTVDHDKKKWLCEKCSKTVKKSELLNMPLELYSVLNLARELLHKDELEKQHTTPKIENREPTLAEKANMQAAQAKAEKRQACKETLVQNISTMVNSASKDGKNAVIVGYLQDPWWHNETDVEKLCDELTRETGINVKVASSKLDYRRQLEEATLGAYW